MTESLHRVLAALTSAEPDLDVWSIADALWLGTMAGNELGSTEPDAVPSPGQPEPANPVTHTPKPLAEDPLVPGTLRQRLPGGRDSVPGHEIVVRPPQAFTASQLFARALQPLTRPWLHGSRRIVDIDATVDAYASSGILSPVLKPEPERWFDVVVIADTTSSMAVWRREITAFIALLRGIGAFRNTYVWHLDPSSACLTDKHGTVDNPARRAAIPGGRRLVILLSDFASAGWRTEPAWHLVHTLATTAPLVLIDPLPPHLWPYSGLASPTTVARPAFPGARSNSLRFHLPLALQALEPDGTWLPIPFSSFTAPGLAQWAKALMRAEPDGCEAILVNLDWITDSASMLVEEKPVADRVDAFLHTASPCAARLAVLCSPFPRFSLPLLDLIRHTAVRDADLSDVAEFLVSGLLETVNPGADQPVLSFHNGAAEQLRAHLTYHDAWHTYDAITRHIAGAPEATVLAFGLPAVVVDPDATTLVAGDAHPFAEAASGLQRLLASQTHTITQMGQRDHEELSPVLKREPPHQQQDVDAISITTEMEATSDEIQQIRRVDATLARFSAVHDELTEEERLKRENRKRLIPWRKRRQKDDTEELAEPSISDRGGRMLSDRYELGETLGYGSMSEVHKGRDVRLGRDVAVKVLRADLARDPQFQERFRREAQNVAALNHSAIVAVYDTGETRTEYGPLPYIVMEYVDGRTLRDIVKTEGPLPGRRAMEIMADLCAALDFSHRHGIIHRNVKPANVMITKTGTVKVIGFGIARAVRDGQAAVTQTTTVIGTAMYMPPEQARGETADARSDVYATGCVLFELLTGEPPFTGDSPVAVAYQHVREDPRKPSQVNSRVSPQLDAIVLKAMAKGAANRYQSAAEMRMDIIRVLSGQRPSAQ